MVVFPFVTPALRVQQPLGTYYVAILPADLLLQVAFSDVMSAVARADGSGYDLTGTQRLKQPKRLTQIADYIAREDAAFPNSIILAGNFLPDTGLIEDDDDAESDADAVVPEANLGDIENQKPSPRGWSITESPESTFTLTIPTAEKLAAIIDGQHRLFSFAELKSRTRLDMDLICSVFLDLPKPYQAQLFATINSTQKPVDKSLTYELFGYNISDDKPAFWTPDKLAVFLTRKLGTEETSPLKGRIIVAPKRDSILELMGSGKDWKVSTAVVVEGVMRLFSANPKRDTNFLLTPHAKERSYLGGKFSDKSPLRSAYLSGNDTLIYTMVLNYLLSCQEVLWASARPGSFITKTVGVQATFDILRKIALVAYEAHDIRVNFFRERLQPAASIDFSAEEFRKASGSGRSTIRRAIEAALGSIH